MSNTVAIPSCTLLKLEPGNKPIFIVLHQDAFIQNGETREHFEQVQEYIYEEGSCPSNWMPHCVAIIQDGGDDPHGCLKYIATRPLPPEADVDTMNWQEIFPEAFSDKEIEGEVVVEKSPKILDKKD